MSTYTPLERRKINHRSRRPIQISVIPIRPGDTFNPETFPDALHSASYHNPHQWFTDLPGGWKPNYGLEIDRTQPSNVRLTDYPGKESLSRPKAWVSQVLLLGGEWASDFLLAASNQDFATPGFEGDAYSVLPDVLPDSTAEVVLAEQLVDSSAITPSQLEGMLREARKSGLIAVPHNQFKQTGKILFGHDGYSGRTEQVDFSGAYLAAASFDIELKPALPVLPRTPAPKTYER